MPSIKNHYPYALNRFALIFVLNISGLSSIKQLAGQTFWYGISSIAARFINYLLTPLLTYNLANKSDYGKIGLIYAAIPLLNVLFTFAFDTAYFRFSSRQEYKTSLYSTSFFSIFFSTLILTAFLWIFRTSFATITGLADVQQVVNISIFIVAFDALSNIPFALLRQQGRPIKFAIIKIAGILINIAVTAFFVIYCPRHINDSDKQWIALLYDAKTNPVVYVVLANLLQSVFTLLFLAKEIAAVKFIFNTMLWKEMMIYALPLLIAGFGGMINETLDRLMLRWWLPGTVTYKENQVGIYNACYKISILITLFIQAFRMGAEPFFFKQAEAGNPKQIYARVMKFFVITVSVVFLIINLFLPIWQYFIRSDYREGLRIVPILVLANMFLGIYYNLSIWYKVTNKTMAGAIITILGASVTILINWLFIPRYGYMASAWATFVCYAGMMILSYTWGQKQYPVPYNWKKLLAYMVIVVLLYFIHTGITSLWNNTTFYLTCSVVFTAAFCFFILKVEKKEFVNLPFIGGLLQKIL